jgi:hypothetical protein
MKSFSFPPNYAMGFALIEAANNAETTHPLRIMIHRAAVRIADDEARHLRELRDRYQRLAEKFHRSEVTI